MDGKLVTVGQQVLLTCIIKRTSHLIFADILQRERNPSLPLSPPLESGELYLIFYWFYHEIYSSISSVLAAWQTHPPTSSPSAGLLLFLAVAECNHPFLPQFALCRRGGSVGTVLDQHNPSLL